MSSIAMLIGRVLLSLIFIQAGLSKLMNVSGTIAYFEGLGLPLASLLIWLVVLVELVGGLLLLTGFYIRIAAAVLAAFCIATAFTGHSDWANVMDFQAFMKDIAIAGGLLYVAAAGAGLISFDTRRGV
ncbi:MAG: DoxX family protein [Rhizobiaceae bacterium]|nr:DoxX family protein [Rhizobiaceae bacterium]